MMQQTCNKEKIVEIQSKGKCPHPYHSCQQSRDICECPQGVLGPRCDQCLSGFWAYTSFGCLDCGCSVMGSDKGKCDEFTGKCHCKKGFSGDKCEVCPDGSQANLDGCLNRKFPSRKTLLFKVFPFLMKNTSLFLCYSWFMIFILFFEGSTKYAQPISCGLRFCDFGATCSGSHCLCEIDCSSPIFYTEVNQSSAYSTLYVDNRKAYIMVRRY